MMPPALGHRSLSFHIFPRQSVSVFVSSLEKLQEGRTTVPPKMGTTDSSSPGSIVMLIVILLGIAIPIIVFWVLIVWCSRRKRKRMAAFNKAAANADPVAEDVEAPPADGTPAARSPAEGGDGAPKSKKSEVKSVEKSGKSAKSKEQTQTGGDEKTT